MPSRNKWWAKTLRVIGIVLMSLTAAFTLMGGAGTSCVALSPAKWGDKFAPIANLQWLYILFVLITLAIGVMGVRAVVLLVKGARNAYRYSMLALLFGTVIGVIHVAVSRSLRGSSMPVDMVVYTTVLTLIVFLLFRIPGVWAGVNFEKPTGDITTGKNAAAIALAVSGLLVLTIHFLMAPTHTINGVNYANVWHAVLTIIGSVLIASGLMVALDARLTLTQRKLLTETS